MNQEQQEIFKSTVTALKRASGRMRAGENLAHKIDVMDSIIGRNTASRLGSIVGANAGQQDYEEFVESGEERARRLGRGAGREADEEEDRQRGVDEAGAVGTASGAAICGTVAVLTGLVLGTSLLPIVAVGAAAGIWGGFIGNRSGRESGEVGFNEGRRQREVYQRRQQLRDVNAIRSDENNVNIPHLKCEYDPQFTYQEITYDGGRIRCEGYEIAFPRGAFTGDQTVKVLTMRGNDLLPSDHIAVARILHLKFEGELHRAAKFCLDSKCGPYSIGEELLIIFSLYRLENDSTWAPLYIVPEFEGRRMTFYYNRPGILIVTIKKEWKHLVKWYHRNRITSQKE